MAKQKLKKISQAELDRILEQHELWLKSNGQAGFCADLSLYDLRTLEFPLKTSLAHANLWHVNLWQVDLRGADLRNAYLDEANLDGANLDGASLRKASLRKASLRKASLRKASLRKANLREANLREANLREADLLEADLLATSFNGANFEGVDLTKVNLVGALGLPPYPVSLTTNLEEQVMQQQFKINQLEQKLQKAQAENNESQEQQEKITQLEQELKQAKQDRQELEQLKQISNAHGALTNSLTNTETQIKNNQKFSALLGQRALWLIKVDIVYIVIMPFIMVYTKFYDLMANKVGIWGILFLTFPALLILLVALALLRHQKQLIAEIRHYSMLKHKIELYGGILQAAQFIAFAQNSEEDNFMKDTFNQIKTELLKSPNFDLNNQPHIFPEEGGNIAEVIKSTITECMQKATSSNK